MVSVLKECRKRVEKNKIFSEVGAVFGGMGGGFVGVGEVFGDERVWWNG